MMTLHPYDDASNYSKGPYALLPDQLQSYLSELTGYSSLKQLSLCDPYDSQRFSSTEAEAMRSEIEQLRPLVINQQISPPPSLVSNSPGETPNEPYGWEGLLKFCDTFSEVLNCGIESKNGIASLGD